MYKSSTHDLANGRHAREAFGSTYDAQMNLNSNNKAVPQLAKTSFQSGRHPFRSMED